MNSSTNSLPSSGIMPDAGEKPKQTHGLRRKILRILGGLLTFFLMALAALSLILAKPPESEDNSPQPLLTASPGITIDRETELPQLLAAFPAPVISFMSGSGLSFVSGSCENIALEGGFGRIATLRWRTPSGEELLLESVYPASATQALQSSSYHFTPAAGPALLGSVSVRMESGDQIRLHTTTDSGLYAVTFPRSLQEEIPALTQSLQLFTLDPEP